ncbi:amidohydrolase family protein [Nocardia otitidiscaviarum]|uniref:amidohydrolase family protein n=1 Tax=Nocardia otitidiscaviarum TaxID=1823 RepID=UPI000693D85E|nr:amidohydrolase family protein [Nocardia otitidiscaviarum]MBF6137879.1 amidohydrolase family protein [Nocardia otitidiscaviarum]MBF6488775.1 amidohydrolase family protein [Nocardia otitidiscaviarum]
MVPQSAAAPGNVVNDSVVIGDVTVYTATVGGPRWASGQDVVVEHGRVTAIGPKAGAGRALPTVDGGGGHLIPGFVNTHTHLQQSVLRGAGEGLPLLEWLHCVGEFTVAATPEQTYAAALAGGLELLRGGVTTVVEHMWPNPSAAVHDAALRALHELGIRVVFGRGLADRADASRRWGMDPRLLQPLSEAFAHIDTLDARLADTRVTTALAVPNPRCLTPEGMAAVRDYADRTGKTISIHLLETRTDEDMCRAHASCSAVDYLDRGGLLGPRTLAVHCCHLDEYGRGLFAERGVAVSYNPLSNMRLGSGVAPIPAMLAKGIGVGLGVDGAASNDTQDMLLALRMGAYLQRVTHARADLLGFDDMMRMATRGAAAALGDSDGPVGIAVGDRADLTLLRFDRDFACLPVRDPGATVLTTASPRVVDTVWVDGEAVLRDGHSTRIDEPALTKLLLGMQ